METHSFGYFVPPKCQYLLLGSFVARPVDGYDWFYAHTRNQFWPILQEVYSLELDTKAKQQALFRRLRMAITDIILSCERKVENNSDMNLTRMTFNTEALHKICNENRIKKLFFTSRFVETLFRRQFKDLISERPTTQLITLPSPSPRYATMSKFDKIARYKEFLPGLE